MPPKTRVELRFDAHLHERIKALAAELDVSVNQLVQSVMAWAVDHANVGLPEEVERGVFATTEAPAVWFGDEGVDEDGEATGEGFVAFALDFSTTYPIRHPRDLRRRSPFAHNTPRPRRSGEGD